MKTKFKMNGFSNINKMLKGLQRSNARKQILRRSAKKAFKPIYDEVLQNCPVLRNLDANPNATPNALKNSIKWKTTVNATPKTTKKGKITEASQHELWTRVNIGDAQTKDYLFAVEYGRDSFTQVSTMSFGREVDPYFREVPAMGGQYFITRAFLNNRDLVIRNFQKELGKELIKEIKKEARKYKRSNKTGRT